MPTTHAPTPPLALHEHAAALGLHLNQCRLARRRWSGTAAFAQRLHGRLMPRFVTLVAAVLVLLALALAMGARWS